MGFIQEQTVLTIRVVTPPAIICCWSIYIGTQHFTVLGCYSLHTFLTFNYFLLSQLNVTDQSIIAKLTASMACFFANVFENPVYGHFCTFI